MLYDLIEDGQARDEFIFTAFYHPEPSVQSEIYPVYAQFEIEREQRKLILKGIVPSKLREQFKVRNQKHLRYTDDEVMLNVNVFKDKVSLTPWGRRKVSFLLRSAVLAEQFRSYMLHTWNSLKPEPMKSRY